MFETHYPDRHTTADPILIEDINSAMEIGYVERNKAVREMLNAWVGLIRECSIKASVRA